MKKALGRLPASANGHDEFADYWSQEMVRDLQGLGPQVRRDTFPVTWFGQAGSIAQAGRVIMIGWPVDLGPFSGIEATPWGDSLVGNLLFDGRLGIQVKPGVTAQFVAGRSRPPRH